MHNGALAESGTHDELMQLQARYAALYSSKLANLFESLMFLSR